MFSKLLRNRQSFFFRACMIAVLAAVALSASPAEARKKKSRRSQSTTSSPNNRYASIVIDAADGRVISERYADKKLYPASLTKMMTLYLAFEAINNGTMRKSQRIPVSKNAAKEPPSALRLEAGSTIRVEDAILALVTKSANDVATALGEALGGGSEDRFLRMMNARAKALGMKSTRFMNASGLYDPAQVSSARDMSILSRALILHYPGEYQYFSTSSFTWAGNKMGNHNHLMRTYKGMDGIKTGYVRQSGFNLAASAVRGNTRLIGVVFGGRTTSSRNAHMAKLLDTAFAEVAKPRLASRKPKFDALGLVSRGAEQLEQGDAGDAAQFVEELRPKSISTRTLGAYMPPGENAGSWTIQIGSFSTRSSSARALEAARGRLSRVGYAQRANPTVVPLVTNRGTIYRARLTGLARAEAEDACRVLKESCLILAAE